MARYNRIHRFHTITINATIDKVFFVLCLVREGEWLPGFTSEIVHSSSGFTELDSVFLTHTKQDYPTVWVIPAYNKFNFIEMIYVQPNVKSAIIKLYLEEESKEKINLKVDYTYTALSERGNNELNLITEENFIQNINTWQVCLNYYFRHGTLIPENLLR